MIDAYSREMAAAIAAVRRAAGVCRAVQAGLVTADTLEKKDKSPVTVADFASQAVVLGELAASFPDDPAVAEEDAAELREAGHAALKASVVEHVNRVLDTPADEATVLGWIDRGGARPAADAKRFWTLDPIDGTKGFLRRDQYAIALALIERGRVVLGVLGCPNLDGQGLLMTAVKNVGAKAQPLDGADAKPKKVTVSGVESPADARFCESVETGHSDQSASSKIAARLGITAEPYRIDSQCKYAAVARGDASIYLRLPTRADYREKIWDHAAGKLCVEAAGGTVTDITGKPLDFSQGRQLEVNRGVIATNGRFHHEVVAAVQDVLNG